MDVLLFPFAETWWLYGAFVVFVLGMLALDLGVFHRKSHALSLREAAGWTAAWIGLAGLFNLGLWQYARSTFATDPRLLAVPGFDPAAAADAVGLEFLTGFVIEKALAVDNIFVFAVVFSAFSIPAAYQHRVLLYGILGALVFRAIFVALGSVLLSVHWLVVAAGIFLAATGVKLMFSSSEPADPQNNPVVRLARRFLPITPTLEGDRFFVTKAGVRYGTPLLLALLVIEVTDVVFAIDSVPAIYAVTREPFLVFTSNIFAILGLRSLYFLLAGVLDRFHLLKYGLAAVLIFVGLKMAWLNEAFGGKFPIGVSLGIIGALVGGAMLASWVIPARDVSTKAAVKAG